MSRESRICPVSTLYEGEYGVLAFVSKFNGDKFVT